MDLLVVVGEGEVPPRWVARARRLLRWSADDPARGAAQLRQELARELAVIAPDDPGAGARVARELLRLGRPVVLVSDRRGPDEEGLEVVPMSDPGPPMEARDSLLELVGNTPMVRLDRTARDLRCHLLAKLEYLNPGGSVKDRPALEMVAAAERSGALRPGGTIVEPTSGNTGVGLALVAARRGYRCVFVMPDKIAAEKIDLLRAYGAEVVVCPTTVAPEHPDSYYSVSNRLAAEIPLAFKPDQYSNPANPAAHEASTGPEIWRQTGGRVTHFVAGIGTGGTISGVSHYLKSMNPEIQIVGADPEGSVYSGGSGRPYLVEGIGEDFWPDAYDRQAVDRVIPVSDRDSFLTARQVTREEGLLMGGSGGTAVWAALAAGRGLDWDAVVVVLIPDSGRGYLSKLYNDGWMADFGFVRNGGRTVADVLAAKGAGLPTLVHVHPEETVQSAIALLREFEISQVPVVKAEPPLAAAEVVGSLVDRDLLEAAFGNPGLLQRPVSEVKGPPLPTVGSGALLELAVSRLEGAGAVLVLDGGHPVGIVTRSDVLGALAGRSSR